MMKKDRGSNIRANPALLCVRQHIDSTFYSELDRETSQMFQSRSGKELGGAILRRLLEGIEGPPVKSVSFRKGKGCEAAAIVKFPKNKILIILGIANDISGVDVDLVLAPTKMSEIGQTDELSIVHSVVNTNFYSLFHIEARWISRLEFEEFFN